jgi:hypothetical protein
MLLPIALVRWHLTERLHTGCGMSCTCDALKMLERNALSGVLLLRNLSIYQHPLRRQLGIRVMRNLRRIASSLPKTQRPGRAR